MFQKFKEQNKVGETTDAVAGIQGKQERPALSEDSDDYYNDDDELDTFDYKNEQY